MYFTPAEAVHVTSVVEMAVMLGVLPPAAFVMTQSGAAARAV